MIRPVSIAALLAPALLLGQQPSEQSASQGQLDGNEVLFTVLAAHDAAGFGTDLDSPANSPVRKQVRDLLTARPLDSLRDLKRFFADNHQADPVAELNQYISFALTVEGAPDFRSHFRPEELPPDVRKLASYVGQGYDLRSPDLEWARRDCLAWLKSESRQ